MASTHTPVLIIGGGIVGLTASLLLANQGIPSLLIERHTSTSIHPRARSTNARTMEIYRGLSLADAIREAGASLSPSMGIYSGTSLREVVESRPRSETPQKFPFGGLMEATGPEKGAWVTQDCSEPVLLVAAMERGVDTRFGTECLGVKQTQSGVSASLRNRDTGEEYTVTADYMIAADGANSPIREQLGIKRTGQGTLGNLLNILFTADLGELVNRREFSLCQIDTPEICGLFTAINNIDRWIFHLRYDPEKGEKPEDFPQERCTEILHKALGMPDVKVDVKSILPWQVTVRVVEKLQVGRIFLAGDAAHQMPPYAGQGANSGIADVHNLAWKLASVLKHQSSPKLLETYEVERLPVGRKVAEVSGSATDENGLIRWKKNLKTMVGLAGRLHLMSGFGYMYESKVVVQESAGLLGGATWKPWTMPSLFLGLDGRPGSRAPHVWVEKDGNHTSTLDLFGKGFVLLAGSDGGKWVGAARSIVGRLKEVELVAYCVGPNGDVVDTGRRWEIAAGISSKGAILVRPDGFVAWRERRMVKDIEGSLEASMRQVLCL